MVLLLLVVVSIGVVVGLGIAHEVGELVAEIHVVRRGGRGSLLEMGKDIVEACRCCAAWGRERRAAAVAAVVESVCVGGGSG